MASEGSKTALFEIVERLHNDGRLKCERCGNSRYTTGCRMAIANLHRFLCRGCIEEWDRYANEMYGRAVRQLTTKEETLTGMRLAGEDTSEREADLQGDLIMIMNEARREALQFIATGEKDETSSGDDDGEDSGDDD